MDWQVEAIKWREAAWGLPVMAMLGARIEGALYGAGFAQTHWQHIHLIGHSAGSVFIEAFAKEIKGIWPDTQIHSTFLDPYLSVALRLGKETYGVNSDWSDSYFAHDGTSILTEGQLLHAHNVDVTWLDTENISYVTHYCFPSGMAGTTPMTIFDKQVPCSVHAHVDSSHGWPYRFYQRTIDEEMPSAAGYGFFRSKEGGGWDSRGQYPLNNVPVALSGEAALPRRLLPTQIGNPFALSSLPNAMSSLGVTFSAERGIGLTTVVTPQMGRGILEVAGTTSGSSEPAWAAVAVTVTNPVNFIEFDAAFTGTT